MLGVCFRTQEIVPGKCSAVAGQSLAQLAQMLSILPISQSMQLATKRCSTTPAQEVSDGLQIPLLKGFWLHPLLLKGTKHLNVLQGSY